MIPDQSQIDIYLSVLFGNHQWDAEEFLIFRGIGEKGTAQEGVFSTDIPIQPALQGMTAIGHKHAERWADMDIATFVIPAILSGSRADEAGVKALPAVILDLDAVPSEEAFLYLEEAIGRPSLFIHSGGRNRFGPKAHAYYVLDQPGDPAAVAGMSARLAALCGGDNVFKRMTQPVRLPGSIHGKDYVKTAVEIASWHGDSWSLEELEGKIAAASGAWYLERPDVIAARGSGARRMAAGGTGDQFFGFSPLTGIETKDLLDREVREGATDGLNRWESFSRVAGYLISQCRAREMSMEEAKAAVHGYVLTKMIPPWPPHRVDAEWARLLAKDLRDHGPMPEREEYVSVFDRLAKPSFFSPATGRDDSPAPIDGSGCDDGGTGFDLSPCYGQPEEPRQQEVQAEEKPAGGAGGAGGAGDPAAVVPARREDDLSSAEAIDPFYGRLLEQAAHRWVTDPPPVTDWLVEGLIARGEQHMFASEGGSGKSYAMLDLGLRIAAHGHLTAGGGGGVGDGGGGSGGGGSFFSPATSRDDHSLPDCETWLGRKIMRGGTVVLFLNEDSETTVHQRIIRLAGANRRLIEAAGDRLIPLVMPKLGGAFTFCDGQLGQPSKEWSEFFRALHAIPDLALVVWDTFSTMLHGSEADSTTVNQMMRQANKVCGELGAASLFLHHVRKNGRADQPIMSPGDMRDAVRGSTAIMGAMRVVMGMWRAHDWSKRAKALGVPEHPDSVWKVAVVKANLDDTMPGERTIIRQDYRLTDVTERDPFASGNLQIRLAWLELAIGKAAKAGYPFTAGGKNDTNGLFQRRHQLPDELAKVGRDRLVQLATMLVEQKRVVLAAAKGGQSAKWLDLPNGDYATNETGADILKGSWSGEDWSKWTFDPGQERLISKDQTLV